MRCRIHHRDIPFRPPYVPPDRTVGQMALLVRFLKRYLLPHRRSIVLCIVLSTLNLCGSYYLMAYYTRFVVDRILVIRTDTDGAPRVALREGHLVRVESKPAPTARLPRDGLQRSRDDPLTAPGGQPGARAWLGMMFGAYLGTIIVLNLMARLSARHQITVGQTVTARLREDLHRKILELPLAYHAAQTPGRLLARILSDVEHVQQWMMSVVVRLFSQLLLIVVGFVLLFGIDYRLGLITLALTPLYAAIYRFTRPYIKRLGQELRHTNSCMYGLSTQKLEGIKAIQGCGRERHEQMVFHGMAACFFRDTLIQQKLGAAIGQTGQIVSSIGANGLVFLYGMHLAIRGELTLGQVLYAYGTAASLFAPVLQLSSMNLMITNLLVVLRRLTEVLDKPISIADAKDAVPLPVPLRRGIRMNAVGFGYNPELEPVLRSVGVEVPAGSWLCLMGPSGAGKSTLLQLLARLYDPDSGEIFYDDLPLRRIRLASLRRHVALVPQEAQIISGSIRDNICYGFPEAGPREIMDAARAAEFHEDIMNLPVQYETLIGERGTTLSGGQRQRLSLARALITDPEILLLDDCTSALDANTEQRIQQTLSRVLKGKTAVIVSQRVSMARKCDRIAVLNEGVVAEYGAHDQLLAYNGFYARLFEHQTA